MRFTLPTQPPFRPHTPDPSEAAGEDVRFTGSLTVVAGDWATVTGTASTDQSVIREASANTGAVLRRPAWGMGITQMLLHSITRANNDSLKSRVRSRMHANPRVKQFLSAELIKLPIGQGQAIIIKYVPIGVDTPIVTKIRNR